MAEKEKVVTVATNDTDITIPDFVKMNEMNADQIRGMIPMQVNLVKQPQKINKEVVDYFYRAQIVLDPKLTVTVDSKSFGQIEYYRILLDRRVTDSGAISRVQCFGRFCKAKRPNGKDYFYVQVWASKNVYLKYYFNYNELDYIADMITAGAAFKGLIWVEVPSSEIETDDVDLGEKTSK